MVNLRSKCVVCGAFLKHLELLSKYSNLGMSCFVVSFSLEAIAVVTRDI